MNITINDDIKAGMREYIEAIKLCEEFNGKLKAGSDSIRDLEARNQAAIYVADAANRVTQGLCKAALEQETLQT